jgi:hypothetical protein
MANTVNSIFFDPADVFMPGLDRRAGFGVLPGTPSLVETGYSAASGTPWGGIALSCVTLYHEYIVDGVNKCRTGQMGIRDPIP